MKYNKYVSKLIRFGLGIVVIAITTVGCHNNTSTGNNDSDNYTTYTDDYNRTVKVPNNPKRIVSISPAITEIIYAIGADNKLVGRTDFCNYPPQADSIESIGGINNFSIEKLLALEPDLVLIGSMVNENTVNHITNAGITLVTIREKDNFEALFDNIEKVGILCGHHNEALSLNDSLRKKVELVTAAIDTNVNYKPTVYYVVGYGKGGNFTAGGNTFINDIFNICGLRNIAEDITGWNYSVEALLEADPDFIIIRKEDMAEFVKTKPYSYLSAVKQGKVIPIESAYIDLQVPRNIDGLVYIHNCIDSLFAEQERYMNQIGL